MVSYKMECVLLVCLLLALSAVADENPASDSTFTLALPTNVSIPIVEDSSAEENMVETPAEKQSISEDSEEITPENPVGKQSPANQSPITVNGTTGEEPPLQEENPLDGITGGFIGLPVQPINETEQETSEQLPENISMPPQEATPEQETNQTEKQEEPAAEQGLLKSIISLLLERLSFLRGELIEIRTQLFHDNSSPISNKPIDFYFDEAVIGTERTDDVGLAAIFFNTSLYPAGRYVIRTTYTGDDFLESSTDSAEVTITEPATAQQNTTSPAVNETVVEEVTKEPIVEEPAIPASNTIMSGKVQELDDCAEEAWEEKEDVWGTCAKEEARQICDDPPFNTSCRQTIEQGTYPCIIASQYVRKTRPVCHTKGFLINTGVHMVQLDTDNYKCSVDEHDDTVTIICDSIFDGNGDGLCTSGESCQQFVVNGEDVIDYEKNSGDDFVEEDDSFFVEKIPLEVLQ